MRRRQTLHIDRRTGEATHTVEELPDADLDTRASELIEHAVEALGTNVYDDTVIWLTLVCDRCGARQEIPTPKLPEGWITTPEGELCPACHG